MIDFTAVLTDLAGKPIEGAALGVICINSLMAAFDDERSLGGEEKVKRFSLAQRIHSAESVNLTAEDTTLLKRLIAKAYAPLIVGRAWELLDPASVK